MKIKVQIRIYYGKDIKNKKGVSIERDTFKMLFCKIF